jgi:hypothetical protein
MALDLLREEHHGDWDPPVTYVPASVLVGLLCREALVCMPYRDVRGEENRVEVCGAECDIVNGLVVTDRDGKRWRLRVSAEEVP